MSTMDCNYVPTYKTRLVAYFLSLAFSTVAVGAALHAQHESKITKDDAQIAVSKLTPGVTLSINTNDVYTAGEVAGIMQLGLLILSILCIALLLFDRRKRLAVANAPHVSGARAPWSSKTLILQLGCFILADVCTIATAITTTYIVATKSGKVTAYLPNGMAMAQALVDAFSSKLSVSPVYKEHGYLVFLAIAPWGGVLFSLIATIVTFRAWRRHVSFQRRPRSDSLDSHRSDEKY